jgi:hypothetical protein
MRWRDTRHGAPQLRKRWTRSRRTEPRIQLIFHPAIEQSPSNECSK